MSDQAAATPPAIDAVLARRGLQAGSALERARRLEAESGERIDRIAAKLGLVADADLASAYAELLGAPVVPASGFPTEPVAADRLRKTFLRHSRVIPIEETESALTVAMADPLDDTAARALAFALDKTVIRRVALPTDIEAAYERVRQSRQGAQALYSAKGTLTQHRGRC